MAYWTGNAAVASGNEFGPKDWPGYWAENIKGAQVQTSEFLTFRTAPGTNWTAQVAATKLYDNTLLTENNAAAQLPGANLYPLKGYPTTAPTYPTSTDGGAYAYVVPSIPAPYLGGSAHKPSHGSWWGGAVQEEI